MLDDNDIRKLVKAQKEVFVTKEEFEGLVDIVATKEEVNNLAKKLDGRMGKIENVIKKMDEKLDEISGLKHRVEYIENSLNIQPLKS